MSQKLENVVNNAISEQKDSIPKEEKGISNVKIRSPITVETEHGIQSEHGFENHSEHFIAKHDDPSSLTSCTAAGKNIPKEVPSSDYPLGSTTPPLNSLNTMNLDHHSLETQPKSELQKCCVAAAKTTKPANLIPKGKKDTLRLKIENDSPDTVQTGSSLSLKHSVLKLPSKNTTRPCVAESSLPKKHYLKTLDSLLLRCKLNTTDASKTDYSKHEIKKELKKDFGKGLIEKSLQPYALRLIVFLQKYENLAANRPSTTSSFLSNGRPGRDVLPHKQKTEGTLKEVPSSDYPSSITPPPSNSDDQLRNPFSEANNYLTSVERNRIYYSGLCSPIKHTANFIGLLLVIMSVLMFYQGVVYFSDTTLTEVGENQANQTFSKIQFFGNKRNASSIMIETPFNCLNWTQSYTKFTQVQTTTRPDRLLFFKCSGKNTYRAFSNKEHVAEIQITREEVIKAFLDRKLRIAKLDFSVTVWMNDKLLELSPAFVCKLRPMVVPPILYSDLVIDESMRLEDHHHISTANSSDFLATSAIELREDWTYTSQSEYKLSYSRDCMSDSAKKRVTDSLSHQRLSRKKRKKEISQSTNESVKEKEVDRGTNESNLFVFHFNKTLLSLLILFTKFVPTSSANIGSSIETCSSLFVVILIALVAAMSVAVIFVVLRFKYFVRSSPDNYPATSIFITSSTNCRTQPSKKTVVEPPQHKLIYEPPHVNPPHITEINAKPDILVETDPLSSQIPLRSSERSELDDCGSDFVYVHTKVADKLSTTGRDHSNNTDIPEPLVQANTHPPDLVLPSNSRREKPIFVPAWPLLLLLVTSVGFLYCSDITHTGIGENKANQIFGAIRLVGNNWNTSSIASVNFLNVTQSYTKFTQVQTTTRPDRLLLFNCSGNTFSHINSLKLRKGCYYSNATHGYKGCYNKEHFVEIRIMRKEVIKIFFGRKLQLTKLDFPVAVVWMNDKLLELSPAFVCKLQPMVVPPILYSDLVIDESMRLEDHHHISTPNSSEFVATSAIELREDWTYTSQSEYKLSYSRDCMSDSAKKTVADSLSHPRLSRVSQSTDESVMQSEVDHVTKEGSRFVFRLNKTWLRLLFIFTKFVPTSLANIGSSIETCSSLFVVILIALFAAMLIAVIFVVWRFSQPSNKNVVEPLQHKLICEPPHIAEVNAKPDIWVETDPLSSQIPLRSSAEQSELDDCGSDFMNAHTKVADKPSTTVRDFSNNIPKPLVQANTHPPDPALPSNSRQEKPTFILPLLLLLVTSVGFLYCSDTTHTGIGENKANQTFGAIRFVGNNWSTSSITSVNYLNWNLTQAYTKCTPVQTTTHPDRLLLFKCSRKKTCSHINRLKLRNGYYHSNATHGYRACCNNFAEIGITREEVIKTFFGRKLQLTKLDFPVAVWMNDKLLKLSPSFVCKLRPMVVPILYTIDERMSLEDHYHVSTPNSGDFVATSAIELGEEWTYTSQSEYKLSYSRDCMSDSAKKRVTDLLSHPRLSRKKRKKRVSQSTNESVMENEVDHRTKGSTRFVNKTLLSLLILFTQFVPTSSANIGSSIETCSSLFVVILIALVAAMLVAVIFVVLRFKYFVRSSPDNYPATAISITSQKNEAEPQQKVKVDFTDCEAAPLDESIEIFSDSSTGIDSLTHQTSIVSPPDISYDPADFGPTLEPTSKTKFDLHKRPNMTVNQDSALSIPFSETEDASNTTMENEPISMTTSSHTLNSTASDFNRFSSFDPPFGDRRVASGVCVGGNTNPTTVGTPHTKQEQRFNIDDVASAPGNKDSTLQCNPLQFVSGIGLVEVNSTQSTNGQPKQQTPASFDTPQLIVQSPRSCLLEICSQVVMPPVIHPLPLPTNNLADDQPRSQNIPGGDAQSSCISVQHTTDSPSVSIVPPPCVIIGNATGGASLSMHCALLVCEETNSSGQLIVAVGSSEIELCNPQNSDTIVAVSHHLGLRGNSSNCFNTLTGEHQQMGELELVPEIEDPPPENSNVIIAEYNDNTLFHGLRPRYSQAYRDHTPH